MSLTEDLEISEVTYTISRDGGFEQSGTIDVFTEDGSFKALVLLPSASAYRLDLEAKTVTGAVCNGQSRFDIWPDAKTAVNVAIRCLATPQIGTADVSGFFNSCPSIDSALALPQQAAVGDSVDLFGAGSDSDSDSAALTYLWTTSSGAITDDRSAHATLRCTAPGVATVRLTVSDGDFGCDTTSPVVDVTCMASAPASNPPGSIPGTGGTAPNSGDPDEADAGM